MTSYKVEVTDGSGYASNGLRFDNAIAAEAYAVDLACRWLAVRDWRIVESEDPVTNPGVCDDPGAHQARCLCNGGEPQL